MKRCKGCGAKLQEEINICPNCGSPIGDRFSANQSSLERLLRDSIVRSQTEHDKKYFEKNTSKRFNLIFAIAIIGVLLFVGMHFIPDNKFQVLQIPGIAAFSAKQIVALLSILMSAPAMMAFYAWSRRAMARTHTPLRMMLTANLHTCVAYAILSVAQSLMGGYVKENDTETPMTIFRIMTIIDFIVLVQYEVYTLLLGKMLSYNFEGDFKYVGKILMLVAVARLIYISLFIIYSPSDPWTLALLFVASALTLYLYILIKRILR